MYRSTMASSPAISSLVNATTDPPADGWCSSSVSQWTKNGNCGSIATSLMPICCQRRLKPSGRRR